MPVQDIPQPQTEIFSLDFFEPAIALVNFHRNVQGAMHSYVSELENLLQQRLSPGSGYHLILNPINKRDHSFSPEDLASINRCMVSLSGHFPCRRTYFIMNEGLSYHLHRAMAESFSTEGVRRAVSLGDAIGQIEADMGAEIIFDHLPVSCC